MHSEMLHPSPIDFNFLQWKFWLKGLLWGSFPCTAGGREQGGLANWEAHWEVLNKLLNNFKEVAQIAQQYDGGIALEWPRTTWLWGAERVQTMIDGTKFCGL